CRTRRRSGSPALWSAAAARPPPPGLRAAARRGRPRLRSTSAPKRPELVPDEIERHDEDDRDRGGDDLPPADPVEEDEEPELRGRECHDRDDEEAHALVPEMAFRVRERPVAVPP